MVFTSSTQQNTVVKFNCEIKQSTFRYFHEVQTCQVKEYFYIHQTNIELEHGSHQEYVKITAFSIVNKSIFYLPKRIEIFFPNLEFLEVIHSALKKITSENLKPFHKLKYLDLSCNNIQILESKLFQFNSKLEVLILNENEISTVDQSTFFSLFSLKFVGFLRNRCFSDMTKNCNEVQNIIESIKFSCSETNNRHSMNIENVIKFVIRNSADIANLKTSQADLMDVHNNTQILASLNHQITRLETRVQEISANLPAEKTSRNYLIISNIILIFLFLGIVVYLCGTKKSQKTTQISKPLRIDPPTYPQLVESSTQMPLPTPLNLNYNSICGQYEIIDEHKPITPKFEDFYSEVVGSVKNEERYDGSASYAVVYRSDRT